MKTVFIDRDGVINKDPGGWTKYNYVTDWKDFHFLCGSLDALKLLHRNGFRIVIVSNQAGVNKGFFTRADLDMVNKKMLKEIAANSGKVEGVYYCIHREEDNCACRKPKTGLLETAAKKHHMDLHTSCMIGDSEVDIAAGKRAGCRTILVLSGKTSEGDVKRWKDRPDYVFRDLLEAVKWLVEKRKRREMRALRRRDEVTMDERRGTRDEGRGTKRTDEEDTHSIRDGRHRT